ERGRVIGSDRELSNLQQELAGRAREKVAEVLRPSSRASTPVPERPSSRAGFAGARSGTAAKPARDEGRPTEREGITTWNFDTLPEVVDTPVAGGVVRGYPALIDQGKTVAIRIETSADTAESATRAGVLRLLLLSIPSPA